jgi:hypothetical protein
MVKKIKKILLIILVAGEALVLSVPYAWAIHIPSADEMAGDLEERYHIDTETLQNQGEYANVVGGKSTVPQVMVYFSPTDPQAGKKITAHAYPMYFSNPKEKLYYTWYLKHNIAEKYRKEPVSDEGHDCNNLLPGECCDRDGDECCEVKIGKFYYEMTNTGNINWNRTEKDSTDPDPYGACQQGMNDFIIEAMRIIAQNGYDISKSYKPLGCDFDDNSPAPACNNFIDPDPSDDDNYFAPIGGDDKKDMPKHCYLHDFADGINYEIVNEKDSEIWQPVCDAGYHAVCADERDETITAGGSDVTTTTCRVSASTPHCDPDAGFDDDDIDDDEDGETGDDDERVPDCTGENRPICVKDGVISGDVPTDDLLTTVDSCNVQDDEIRSAEAKCKIGTLEDSQEPSCFHVFASQYKMNLETGLACDVGVGDDSFGGCEEQIWGTDPDDPDTADNGNFDEANIAGLGQETFTWTYQEGDQVGVLVEGTSIMSTKYDDASAMIMWAFPKNECPPEFNGKAEGGTYKIVKDTKNISVGGYSFDIPITRKVDKYPSVAEYIKFSCLDNNWIDPREGGQAAKLTTELSYIPENPTNDPTGDKLGDMLTVNAATDGARPDATQLYYDWRVKANTDMTLDSSSWTDMTEELICDGLITGPTKGNNIDTLKIKLDINKDGSDLSKCRYAYNPTRKTGSCVCDGNDDDPAIKALHNEANKVYNDIVMNGESYLRIFTTVKEFFAKKSTRDGRSDVIVKIQSTEDKLKVFGVAYQDRVGSDDKRDRLASSIGAQKCEFQVLEEHEDMRNAYKYVCPILKNDIIGLRVCGPKIGGETSNCPYKNLTLSNYNWTLNGEPLICKTPVMVNDPPDGTDRAISLYGCRPNKQTRFNYFPVTGNPGDRYAVEVTANDVDNLVEGKKADGSGTGIYTNQSVGSTVHFVKVFEVVDPFVEIISTDQDNVWPKFLGDYIDVGVKTTLDNSYKPEFSKTEFESLSETPGKFKAIFHPFSFWYARRIFNPPKPGCTSTGSITFSPDCNTWASGSAIANPPLTGGLNFEWLVDGVKVEGKDNNEFFDWTVAGIPGDTHTIAINAAQYRGLPLRQALRDIWGINQFDVIEENMSNQIQVKVVENDAVAKAGPKNMLAFLSSHFPSQVVFMLRVLLTIFVILMTTSIVFSFIPEIKTSRYD